MAIVSWLCFCSALELTLGLRPTNCCYLEHCQSLWLREGCCEGSHLSSQMLPPRIDRCHCCPYPSVRASHVTSPTLRSLGTEVLLCLQGEELGILGWAALMITLMTCFAHNSPPICLHRWARKGPFLHILVHSDLALSLSYFASTYKCPLIPGRLSIASVIPCSAATPSEPPVLFIFILTSIRMKLPSICLWNALPGFSCCLHCLSHSVFFCSDMQNSFVYRLLLYSSP
jgi:hypothetical protein